jgi:hypothetical protein
MGSAAVLVFVAISLGCPDGLSQGRRMAVRSFFLTSGGLHIFSPPFQVVFCLHHILFDIPLSCLSQCRHLSPTHVVSDLLSVLRYTCCAPSASSNPPDPPFASASVRRQHNCICPWTTPLGYFLTGEHLVYTHHCGSRTPYDAYSCPRVLNPSI